MTLTASSTQAPAFFGRMPLLLSEQKRLADLVDSLRELCQVLEVGAAALPPRLDPPKLVDELARVLAEHFAGADDALCRVAQRHDLLPAVVDLRSDHAALSDALSDLRLVAEDQAQWTELPRRIATLLRKLAAHREVEAALIQEAARPANVA
jgi:hypothetical protein